MVQETDLRQGLDWIGLSSVLRPLQHSIGYMGDGFYTSKDPTNSIKVLKEEAVKENNTKNKENTNYTCIHRQKSRQIQHTSITQQVPYLHQGTSRIYLPPSLCRWWRLWWKTIN